MKKAAIALGLVLIVSCKSNSDSSFEHTIAVKETVSNAELVKHGEEIFNGKGVCNTCHLKDQKIIGPSIPEMATAYKEKNGNMIAFLKEEAKSIMDSTQFLLMKPNFVLTKTMTEKELQSLEAYVFSFVK